MSAAEALSPLAEEGRQSTGVLNYFFGKLGRSQRSRAASTSSAGVSGNTEQETFKGKERTSGHARLPKPLGVKKREEEEVSSLPQAKNTHALTGPRVAKLDSRLQRIAEQRNASPVAEDSNGEYKVPCSRDSDTLFPLSGRSASDSAAQWDFRRREVRRSSRSAQEWVRTSLMETNSDSSRGLQDYLPGKDPDHLLGTDQHLTPTTIEEDGMRLRRRSRSARDLRGADVGYRGEQNIAAKQRRSLSNHREGKRTSFEAGLDQNPPYEPIRRSAEKVRRHAKGDMASGSDFLPAELIQRSILFSANPEASES